MYKKVGVKKKGERKGERENANLGDILARHMSASSSGGTRSAHSRDILRNNSSRSSLLHVLLVHGDGAVVSVHGGDLCAGCCGSGAGTCHGALDMSLEMAILMASHQISAGGRVDLLSRGSGRGDVLVVGWDVARSRGASGGWVLKTGDVGGLLVRDDGGMDQVGICGLGTTKGHGLVILVMLVMLVLMAEKTMMVFVVVLGWDSGSGMAGKALLTAKRVLVSGTVDRVSVGDGSITNSSAGVHRHGRRLVVIIAIVQGVQRIDGVLTSMVGGRGVDGVGSVASIAGEVVVVVSSMESRAGLVRVVVDVGVMRLASELVGDLGSLLLDPLHGCGLGSGGGG